ncbi:HTH-type transcriptional regulator ImmR [Clostridiales bacterium CHKCI001]|nr:HTH-type transcriptional regulator ImmR [Clostridiales bacterium CHKCI001]
MILSEKLIMLRKKNGWSQEELAMKMDISRQSVSKWESGSSLPDLDKIIKLSQIFDVSTDFLLKDSLEYEDNDPEHEKYENKTKMVSLEEANRFMDLTAKMAWRFALAATACVFSPVVLILLGGMSEYYGGFSEDTAGGIGVIVLLLIIGGAVASFILNGMQLEKYEHLEKEVFSLQYGVEGIVRKKKEEFESTHRICVAVGVTLCIISAIPLLIAAAFQASELILVYCVDLLLIIVSAAVYLFVWSGMIFGSYQKLLQEGDYTEEKKEREKKISPVAGIYWCIITAIYLWFSLSTMDWERTWIIWPVAGVLFGAVCGIINMIHGKSSK